MSTDISSGYSCDAMQAYNYDCHCACPTSGGGLSPPEPNEGHRTCDTNAISAACTGDNMADLLTGNICRSVCTTTVIENWDACNRGFQEATRAGNAGSWADTESMLSTMGSVVQMCRGSGH